MTAAICIRCGAFKLGAFTPCEKCGAVPETEDDYAASFILTDHFTDRPTLEKIGEDIASGIRPRLTPDSLPPDMMDFILRSGRSAKESFERMRACAKKQEPRKTKPSRSAMTTTAARINGLEVSVCGAHELPDFTARTITDIVSVWDGYEAENEERRNYVSAVFPDARTHFAFFNDLLSNSTAPYAPSTEAVRAILEFTTALGSGSRLLVHCKMGISRSTAIALATLNFHAGPGHEAECFVALRRIRPSAYPNPMMIQFADAILGRNGALIESIKNCVATAAV